MEASLRSGVRSLRNYFYRPKLKTKICYEPPTCLRNVPNEIIKRLSESESRIIIEEHNKEACGVEIVFCPIVSRAGTDIEAALSRLSGDKPTLVFVLHHTFDPDHNAPNSSSYENNNLMLVDLLFHEDTGLLKCSKNDGEITKARNYLEKYGKQLVVLDKRVLMKMCFSLTAIVGICVVYRKWKGFHGFQHKASLIYSRLTIRSKPYIHCSH